jgi:DNA primase
MPRDDEFINRLRSANPIENVMGSYVALKRRGRNYICSCPFHSEKTPSCTIFTDTQSFYCFGCGAGGDVITFIEKIENLDFVESINLLAQRSGIEVPQYSNAESNLHQKKTKIYEMNRIAAKFFHLNFKTDEGKEGLRYLADRCITPQTLKKYGLGYALNSWDALTEHLRKQGYSYSEIADSGLGTYTKNGKVIDMFRKRVMFPIIDLRGNVIGFGGRITDGSSPKYLNTGTTPVFDKGSNLFSMNFAKNHETKRIILCEGYMDVITLNQAGFENAVATLGTAITPNQARLISHYADEVIIAYDSDNAGQNATQKAIGHFSDVGMRTKIIHMEDAKDPDEYIKKFGSVKFGMLLDKSVDAIDFMLDKCERGLDLSTELDKVELLRRVSKVLTGIESAMEREVYISRTAEKCNIPSSVLRSNIEELIDKSNNSAKKREWRNITTNTTYIKDDMNPEVQQFPKESRAEESIIYYLLSRPEEWKQISEKAPADIFVTSLNRHLYSALLTKMSQCENFSLSVMTEEFSADEMSRISGIIARHRDFGINSEVVEECAGTLKKKIGAESVSSGGGTISDDELRNLFDSKRRNHQKR